MAVSDTMGTEFRNPAIVPYRTVLRSPPGDSVALEGKFHGGETEDSGRFPGSMT